jgi:hypothetical protein
MLRYTDCRHSTVCFLIDSVISFFPAAQQLLLVLLFFYLLDHWHILQQALSEHQGEAAVDVVAKKIELGGGRTHTSPG